MEFSKLSRVKLLNLLTLVSLLSSCSLFEPFVDRCRNAGAANPAELYVGRSTPEKPAVCYNILTTNYTEVKKLADEECLKHKTGTHAVPVKQTQFTCRLFLPTHIYFKCEK